MSGLLVFVVVMVVLCIIVDSISSVKGEYICRSCKSIGSPVTKTSGSIFIEIILWLCFIVPGLIYSIWRLTTKKPICCACGSENIIPTNTPAGRELAGVGAPVVQEGEDPENKILK